GMVPSMRGWRGACRRPLAGRVAREERAGAETEGGAEGTSFTESTLNPERGRVKRRWEARSLRPALAAAALLTPRWRRRLRTRLADAVQATGVEDRLMHDRVLVGIFQRLYGREQSRPLIAELRAQGLLDQPEHPLPHPAPFPACKEWHLQA